ncbi:hypothetical protein JM16_006188 [Phytophthora kernoviae]|uniref:Fido domain-containing protein n=1 Tax=Phytophthora kernoviae TaxID=325452 RepID=A0A8T0LWE7_9STRA|nr:hypothetical protein JM16_006188 [Phytophthora kernoviae]
MRRLRDEHGADVNAADYDKRTPLHIAVSDNQVEMVDYLLQCGANAEALDRWGRSPIDCALETRNEAVLRLLEREHYAILTEKFLQFEDSAKPPTEDKEERRSRSTLDVEAFFKAVEEGNTENVKRAWLSGMEVNVTDESGRTSLHVAVENGQLGVIELLLSAGVNTNIVDASGRSPISIAIEKQKFAIVEMLRAHQKKKLVIHKVQSSEDQQNIARAFRATKHGDLEELKQLVPEMVRPDMEDYDLRTLLHVASAEGHLQIAKYLVDCGANVNLLDRWGSSPLSDAVDFAHNELAKYLIANHATESGFRSTVAVDHIDNATLNGALEFTLRVVTRNPWLMGQVHCPMLDDDNSCVLITHSIWQKNSSAVHRQHKPSAVLSPRVPKNHPYDTTSLLGDAIQKYRKVASTIMIDPGQGHSGNVFSGQHPEWLNLRTAQQSQFFLLPHARRAGIETVVSVPMICKMSTVAVLSWYSDRSMSEDQHELQRIQRVIRSVMILSTLRQDLLSAASSNMGTGRIPRFQYCQTLDNAITANGELTDASIDREDLTVCDTISLALEWGLFDMVDLLATSMNSEDHTAVVPILRSLVMLLHNGLFNDTLDEHGSNGHDEHDGELSLKHVIEASHGKIRTKWELVGHLKYYLQYLYAVSPTEAELFNDVHELSVKVENYLKDQGENDGNSSDDNASSSNTDDMEMDECPETVTPAEPPAPECVLCKYNVPGHIHPGRAQIPATPAPVRTTLFRTTTSKSPHGERLFGHPGNPKSPVYREIEKLLAKFEQEYDAFDRKSELADCCDGAKTATFTSSDLYDAIGSSHDSSVARRPSQPDNSRKELLDVINHILHDPSCIISHEQLFALHKCLLPASSGQAGVLRTDLAVGYASPRIYRVFIPAGEIADALKNLVDTLNDTSRWQQRPLLCAYYAFAVLVFYIHPFHDGNGRCARLLGNLVAKKLGFPPLLRAADKTIQVAEFLQKAIVTMEIIRNSVDFNVVKVSIAFQLSGHSSASAAQSNKDYDAGMVRTGGDEALDGNDETLEVIELVERLVRRLMKFTWDLKQEDVKDALDEMVAEADSSLNIRFKTHRPVRRQLTELLTEIDKPWTIKPGNAMLGRNPTLGEAVAIIDCQTFVPEFIPVLKALENQQQMPVPFQDGALLNFATLDPGQLKSFTEALMYPVHCTQGPPGTGKSYLGVVVVRALLIVRDLWIMKNGEIGEPPILVLSYKNHAIDEFLLDLLRAEPKFCHNPIANFGRYYSRNGFKKLVRIGGGCNEPELEQYRERNVANADPSVREVSQGIEDCQGLREDWHKFRDCFSPIFEAQTILAADGGYAYG